MYIYLIYKVYLLYLIIKSHLNKKNIYKYSKQITVAWAYVFAIGKYSNTYDDISCYHSNICNTNCKITNHKVSKVKEKQWITHIYMRRLRVTYRSRSILLTFDIKSDAHRMFLYPERAERHHVTVSFVF